MIMAPFILVALLYIFLSIHLSSARTSHLYLANGTTPSPSSSTTAPLTRNLTATFYTSTAASAVIPSGITPSNGSSTLANTLTLDPDLAILAPRRIDFIIAQQSGAKSIPAWMASLDSDGKWPDIDYTTGCLARRANWPASVHWQRLGAMAAAWHGGFTGANPNFVNNKALLAQISLALGWWFARDFAVAACLDNGGSDACPCSTLGLWNTNWFSNVILVPRLVGQTCLLLNATLTASQFGNCIRMTGRTYRTFMRPEPPNWLVGANLLDIASIGIAYGLLAGSAAIVSDAYSRVHQEVHVRTGLEADGILADGSFGQHRGLLYNGNYGKDYSNDVLELEIEGGGTRFAASDGSRAVFESLMDASQWMIYQNTKTGVLHWDFSTEGRFISFPVIDGQATASLGINLTEILQLSKLWNSAILRDVYNRLTMITSSANVGSLLGNRMFWNNDYMVMRGQNYVSTVKMYSSRTRNSECTNTQNPLGFHLADGTTYTYIAGDEYQDISVAWDWNLIPGITVDYGGTPLTCDTENHPGLEDFVGGASTGKIGAAAMRYTNPITRNFSFQKAWFYFPNDVQHVLVSILTSDSATPVFSVLDQRTHRGQIYVDGALASNGNFSRPRTLFHANIGYSFVNSSELSISVGLRTGDWSAIGTSDQPPATVDLFAAWMAHDIQGDGAVEYTVFPARTRSEFEAEAAASPLLTLRADTQVSAVQDGAHATTMAVFWQPEGGAVVVPATSTAVEISVTAQSACVVILDQQVWSVTVADPTQLLASVQITFAVRGMKPSGWGQSETKTFDITLPMGPFAGSSVSQSLLQ